jgi:hypothetical protein
MPALFFRPCGAVGTAWGRPQPTVETVGYYQTSLRDEDQISPIGRSKIAQRFIAGIQWDDRK